MVATPPEAVTVAFHTSPGDISNVKSRMSSELLAPRKRTLMALPFVVSVFTTLMRVALPFCAVKYGVISE